MARSRVRDVVALLCALGVLQSSCTSGPPRVTGDLPEAAKDGNLREIRAHIYWHYDLNKKNVNGDNATPLFLATLWNHTEAAELLLQAGADPRIGSATANQHPSLNVENATPLHVVKNFELAKRLVDAGADVNARDSRGGTPLDFAVFITNRAIVDLLLRHGADVDPASESGSPLLTAVEGIGGVDTGIVHDLLDRGANPFVTTGTGWTLVDLARDHEARGETKGLLSLVESYTQRSRHPQ
jgi:ankyrin repeat protein